MKRYTLPTALLLVTALAVGCEEASNPTALAPDAPAFAPPSKSTDTDSRAVWAWHAKLSNGTTPTRIYGDGRDKKGDPLTSAQQESGITGEYQGEICGVHAKIFWNDPDYSQSGDAVFDPDFNKSGSCAPRMAYIHLEGASEPLSAGFFTNARQVMQLGTSEHPELTRQQIMGFSSTGLANCERLMFGEGAFTGTLATTQGGVVVTRTASAPSAWTVETVDGVGKCYNWSKGKYVQNGPTHNGLHFRITITEVPYPYPTS